MEFEIINELTWLNRFIRTTSFLSIPTGAFGLLSAPLGVANVGLAGSSIAGSLYRKEKIDEEMKRRHKWYMFYSDLKTHYTRKGLLRILKLRRWGQKLGKFFKM